MLSPLAARRAEKLGYTNVRVFHAGMPAWKKAVIILYNDKGDLKSAATAFKAIRGWGYKMVSLLAGGMEAWQKDGNKLATGPAESKIAYVRKLLPGELDLAVFKAFLAKPSEEAIILDVRNSNETAQGTLPNAKTIPLDELEVRLADLPKDRTILVHCSTGVRGEMAYNVLKKAGFKAKYLKANVKFDKDKKGQ